MRNFLRISYKVVNYFYAGAVSLFYVAAALRVRRGHLGEGYHMYNFGFLAVRLAMDESPVSMFLFSKLL